MKDVFEDGHADVAIFQPTYLKEWYTNGFNTTERNAALAEKHPGKFVAQHPLGPPRGRCRYEGVGRQRGTLGLHRARSCTRRSGADGSRGWTLRDPEAFRFLERCQELGVRNIHLHKGPTIWPLDKDAFNIDDVDTAASTFTDLNFIVDHVGLPRIEDFCFMAVQEPNVYAGLAVVIGGLMHARPRMFAKVMGELLFFLGEDRLIFGSDYAIWEPRWQVEGFVDWDYPAGDEFSRVPADHHDDEEEDPRPERRPALRHRRAGRVPTAASRPSRRVDPAPNRYDAPRRAAGGGACGPRSAEVRDPELDEPVTDLGFVAPARWTRRRRPGCGCGCRRTSARRTSCTSWWPTPGTRSARCPACATSRSASTDHFAADVINAGVAGGHGFVATFGGPGRRASSTSCGSTSCARRCWRPPHRACRPLLAAGIDAARAGRADARRRARARPTRDRLRSRRASSGCRPTTGRRSSSTL